ncbi:hypothetical protein BD311DRAFT_769812 [Dichomitus squalens]|uniref:Uncharacterized protein n=1 Tax=Dichomitus squalens TaxID=114155 RepID=A0A4V2JYW7_9APHY|nr:hypothetical protein BD311DRAFT_769812 [Dichomitus squalens]
MLNLRQVSHHEAQGADDSVSQGIQFYAQSQTTRTIPHSLASFAEPVHVETKDPDMEWESEQDVSAGTTFNDIQLVGIDPTS